VGCITVTAIGLKVFPANITYKSKMFYSENVKWVTCFHRIKCELKHFDR
jgi:hypothetical protein